jgi:hypothetical protein
MRTVELKQASLDVNADIIDGLQWARDAWQKVQRAEKEGIFDLDAITSDLESSDIFQNENGSFVQSVYIGRAFNFYPSEKYYAPWSSGVEPFEAECDEVYRDLAEIELDGIGAYLTCGDGDPTDLYVERVFDVDEYLLGFAV